MLNRLNNFQKTLCALAIPIFFIAMEIVINTQNTTHKTSVCVEAKCSGLSSVTVIDNQGQQEELKVIKTNNSNIVVIQSNEVPFVNPNPSSLLAEWLSNSGQDLMDKFLPVGIYDAMPDIKPTSDYQTYDLETLKSLSESGDPIATFYYAMNQVPIDDNVAIASFEKSLIEGGYTAAISQLALAHNSLASANSHDFQRENFDFSTMNENEKQSYAWLLAGKKINDPVSLKILENISIADFSEENQASLELIAAQILDRINQARINIGLDIIEVQALDQDILEFIDKRMK